MPRPSTARLRPAALAALLSAALLAGCGGDDEPSASAPATTAPAVTGRDPSPGSTTTAPDDTAPEDPDGAPGSGAPNDPGAAPTAPRLSPEARRAEKRLFPDLPSLSAIPQTASGTADASDRRVAERWFALVRAGKDAEAGALMTNGTRFANIDVLLLRDRVARVAAAESLPCGAEPVDVGGARGGYVVLTLKLVDKEGLPPCDGAGSPVAVAVHVTDGRIDDWVRVQAPDAPINRGTPV